MALREEKLLEDYFHKLSLEAERVPGSRIHANVRLALHKRSEHAKKLWKKRLWTATTAVVITVLLVVAAGSWMGEGTGLRSALSSFAKTVPLKAYQAILTSDTTVSSAIKAGLMQQVGVSSLEKEGHVLTIDGMAADAMGIIILYSIDNKSEQITKTHQMSLTDSKGAVVGSELIGMHQNLRSGTTLNVTRLTWTGEANNLPDEVEVQLELAKSAGNDQQPVTPEQLINLSVPIKIDKKAMEESGQSIAFNQPLTVAGQTIHIKQVYAGVTGIYVETAYDKNNTQDIFGMLNPRILLGDESEYQGFYLPQRIRKVGREFSVFSNDSTNPNAPLRLTVDGIYALEPSKRELVIDTDKQQILKAPDNALTVEVVQDSAKQQLIVLKHHVTDRNKLSREGNLIMNMSFKDGKGEVHEYDQSLHSFDLTNLFESKQEELNKTGLNLYLIGKEKLPQPLTFTLDSYPNAIKDVRTITLR
ncbi:DUF4179 domain-containing protein [Paenibacillus agri]|uniref:DUF4179 domain-containing protein n=1 Tax=Paenibacillus agri TaxID=2744309 RepID=A0A850EZ16_9BACL|nr:DUF4179 domain-containing protein [Paenibacillus agri]NUU64182.1 DUF4179 domain-containing protein [Paenibacillus agri]